MSWVSFPPPHGQLGYLEEEQEEDAALPAAAAVMMRLLWLWNSALSPSAQQLPGRGLPAAPAKRPCSRAADTGKEGDSLPTRKGDRWLRGRPPAGSAHLGALAALLPPPGRARPGAAAHSAPSRPGERAPRRQPAPPAPRPALRAPAPAAPQPALRWCRRRGPLPAWPRLLARLARAGGWGVSSGQTEAPQPCRPLGLEHAQCSHGVWSCPCELEAWDSATCPRSFPDPWGKGNEPHTHDVAGEGVNTLKRMLNPVDA